MPTEDQASKSAKEGNKSTNEIKGKTTGPQSNRPKNFGEVLEAERTTLGLHDGDEVFGLALSGGGIRSATFNLGVIQALAEKYLLRHFHYLSTVSGGGYIGAWLSLFIKNFCDGHVETAEGEIWPPREQSLEHRAIRFLRSFSNYLTPRMGLLSKDSLVAAATYLRNLLLNQCILVTLMAGLLVLPRIVAFAVNGLTQWNALERWYSWITTIMLVFPAFAIVSALFYRPDDAKGRRPPWFVRSGPLLPLADVPVLVAACISTCFFVQSANLNAVGAKGWSWFWQAYAMYILLWVIGCGLALLCNYEAAKWWFKERIGVSGAKSKWTVVSTIVLFVLLTVVAAAAAAGLIVGVGNMVAAFPESHRLWAAVTIGPPSFIFALLIMVTAYVGFLGRRLEENDRELWSVYGARLIAIALLWAVFFTIALYGSTLLESLTIWISGMGGFVWVLSTLFGVLAGKNKATGHRESKGWIEVLTRIAPYVFMIGLLFVLSFGVHRSLIWLHGVVQGKSSPAAASQEGPSPGKPGIYLRADLDQGMPVVTVRSLKEPSMWKTFAKTAEKNYSEIELWFQPTPTTAAPSTKSFLTVLFEPPWALPMIAVLVFMIGLFLSWRVNINLFSLHHFYRNRLTRCYLGATNKRRLGNPLTGFDPTDDLPISDLAKQRPFHIFGTTINLNRGRQLAWQNRRAASFAFTPLYAGYEPASASQYVRGGYRPVGSYGKDSDERPIKVGTAMAISGAAASPNQGYHTSPAVAFLMTVFNVRLGCWCGNPAHFKAWELRDPLFSLRYWLAELTGSADIDYPFVSLSDGGHFENLGIYELVRRRCSVILASDAGCDAKYAFDDLAEAMRKCYTDFGVKIEFQTNVDRIRPQNDEGLPEAERVSDRHYAIATIKYPGQTKTGTLIYLKSSLTKNLPPDIMNYRRGHGNFPHETTADQWFDESQFESYRHLGYEVAKRSLDAILRVTRQKDRLPSVFH
jgi:hypothetical protein